MTRTMAQYEERLRDYYRSGRITLRDAERTLAALRRDVVEGINNLVDEHGLVDTATAIAVIQRAQWAQEAIPVLQRLLVEWSGGVEQRQCLDCGDREGLFCPMNSDGEGPHRYS